jgi:hypothetical protein
MYWRGTFVRFLSHLTFFTPARTFDIARQTGHLPFALFSVETMALITEIPKELLDMIVSYIEDDRRALLGLARTCRALQPTARFEAIGVVWAEHTL